MFNLILRRKMCDQLFFWDIFVVGAYLTVPYWPPIAHHLFTLKSNSATVTLPGLLVLVGVPVC